MRISDWSSDVCSSDLAGRAGRRPAPRPGSCFRRGYPRPLRGGGRCGDPCPARLWRRSQPPRARHDDDAGGGRGRAGAKTRPLDVRSSASVEVEAIRERWAEPGKDALGLATVAERGSEEATAELPDTKRPTE